MLTFIDRQIDLIEYSHCHLKLKNNLQYRLIDTYDFNLKMLLLIELLKNATICKTDAYNSRLRDCSWMQFTEFCKKKRALLVTLHFKSIDIRIFRPFVYMNLYGLAI